jgi:NADH:ubiquinone oxidoreductase subunit 6 (subunit J)
MEGTLKSGKELLDEIKKYKMVCYMLGGIVILSLFLVVFIGYTTDNHVKILADALNNNTRAINGIGRLP